MVASITDLEAEKIWGSMRFEDDIDTEDFKNKADFERTADQLLSRGKVQNLDEVSKSMIKQKALSYYKNVYPTVHRISKDRSKEKRLKVLSYTRKGIQNKRWIKDDLLILRRDYKVKSDKAIARSLNRTPKSVSRKREQLGLVKRGSLIILENNSIAVNNIIALFCIIVILHSTPYTYTVQVYEQSLPSFSS